MRAVSTVYHFNRSWSIAEGDVGAAVLGGPRARGLAASGVRGAGPPRLQWHHHAAAVRAVGGRGGLWGDRYAGRRSGPGTFFR